MNWEAIGAIGEVGGTIPVVGYGCNGDWCNRLGEPGNFPSPPAIASHPGAKSRDKSPFYCATVAKDGHGILAVRGPGMRRTPGLPCAQIGEVVLLVWDTFVEKRAPHPHPLGPREWEAR